jgi:tetratricopeptide (TPR) repeat protein
MPVHLCHTGRVGRVEMAQVNRATTGRAGRTPHHGPAIARSPHGKLKRSLTEVGVMRVEPMAYSRRMRWPAVAVLAGALALSGQEALPAAASEPRVDGATVPAGKAGAGSVLVALNFDDDRIETGPDSLTVFQYARGTVQLSSAFRWSGLHSVEIHDEAGDHDFPELLGKFPLRRSGRLVVHFALLVATPDEPFNIALAGPRRFIPRPDGMSVWLQSRHGALYHVSGGVPKRLFPLRAFTWYMVDLDLDLDAGVYDLRIGEEGMAQPLTDLRQQPNAAGSAGVPGSAVELFSFIGDLEDVSRVTYYVDDIVVGTDASVLQPPFVAPGRRRFFAESLGDLRRLEDGRLSCLPLVSPADLGLSGAEVETLRASGRLEPLLRALAGELPADPDQAAVPAERAAALWREGCQALERGEAEQASGKFQRAEQAVPGAPLVVMGEALVEIARGRTAAAAAMLGRLAPDPEDPRQAVLEALLLARDGDWGSAQARVGETGEAGRASPLLASARYHLELWQGRFREALAAAKREGLAAADPAARSLWAERAGDAAFLGRDLDAAEQLYSAALGESAHPRALLCRLADVRFLRGDLAGERALRERVYGTLRPERGAAGAAVVRP